MALFHEPSLIDPLLLRAARCMLHGLDPPQSETQGRLLCCVEQNGAPVWTNEYSRRPSIYKARSDAHMY
jgi:hypothetical protein